MHPLQCTQYWRASSAVRSSAHLGSSCFPRTSIEGHSYSKQTTPQNPCSCAGRYYFVQCREEHPSSTLPLYVPSLLILLSIFVHRSLVLSRSPLTATKYTIDLPFIAYEHPHTDTVTVQPYSNILHKCCRSGTVTWKRWKAMRCRQSYLCQRNSKKP